MKPYEEKMLTKDIQRLSAVLGSENAKRLSQAYFLADEDTRERILELIDVIKVVDLNENEFVERETALIKVHTKPEDRAEALRVITRPACERISRHAAALARRRRRRPRSRPAGWTAVCTGAWCSR